MSRMSKTGYARLCLVAGLLFSGVASAVSPEDAAGDYRLAGEGLQVIVQQAEVEHDPSRLKRPDAIALVATLSDERWLPGDDGDLGQSFDICDTANRATMSLALFDLKSHLISKDDPARAAVEVQQVMQRNVIVFRDALIELQPFLIRCQGKLIPLLERFVASLEPEQMTPARRDGLKTARRGVMEMFSTGTTSAGGAGDDQDYAVALLEALVEASGSYASVMPLDERTRMADAFDQMALQVAPEYRSFYAEIARAFRQETCSALCLVR